MYEITLPIINTSAAILAFATYSFVSWRIWPKDKFWSILLGMMALLCAGVAIGYAGVAFADVTQSWATAVLRPLVWPVVLFPAIYIMQKSI